MRQLAALTDDARRETARALLAELTGEAPSVTLPERAGRAEGEPDSPVSGREKAPASEPEKLYPAASGAATAVNPAVLVTKRPDGGMTLRRRAFPETDTELPDGDGEPVPQTRQEISGGAYDRMREVSDFFRRDTRRYDPGFTRY